MGLQPIHLDYYVVNPNTPAHLGRGTVFMDGGNHGEKPAVYMEYRLVSHKHTEQQGTSSTTQGTQDASTSDWIYDTQYQRYRRYVGGRWEWAS